MTTVVTNDFYAQAWGRFWYDHERPTASTMNNPRQSVDLDPRMAQGSDWPQSDWRSSAN